MTFLIGGLLLWSVVHFIPSLAMPLKRSLVTRLGENGYKALFTLFTLGALALIVTGWRSIDQPVYLYQLPLWTRHLGMLLVLLAFILFVASGMPTRIKQFLRHPQLTGVVIWAGAHLLMNGDSRSLLLFGSLGVWAVLEMVLINRRDGIWVKPAVPGIAQEVKILAISAVGFIAVMMAHPWIAGVAVF